MCVCVPLEPLPFLLRLTVYITVEIVTVFADSQRAQVRACGRAFVWALLGSLDALLRALRPLARAR